MKRSIHKFVRIDPKLQHFGHYNRYSFHTSSKTYYPCRVEETEEEKEARWARIKQREIDLCQSNTLLFKILNNKKLTEEDNKILNRLMKSHLEHRMEDIKAEKKKLHFKIFDIEKEIGITIERQNDLEALRKEKLEYEKKLSELENLEGDNIMDRNN